MMPSECTTSAANAVRYHSTIASKRAVRRTTCASLSGAIGPRSGESLARRASRVSFTGMGILLQTKVKMLSTPASARP